MERYCLLTGINISDSDQYPVFNCEYPKLIVFSKEMVECINLYPNIEEFEKKYDIPTDPYITYFIEDILKPLVGIFPFYSEDNKKFNEFKYEFIKKLELTTDQKRLRGWDKEIESKIIGLVIAKLLYCGWELMDREGFWFSKKES